MMVSGTSVCAVCSIDEHVENWVFCRWQMQRKGLCGISCRLVVVVIYTHQPPRACWTIGREIRKGIHLEEVVIECSLLLMSKSSKCCCC